MFVTVNENVNVDIDVDIDTIMKKALQTSNDVYQLLSIVNNVLEDNCIDKRFKIADENEDIFKFIPNNLYEEILIKKLQSFDRNKFIEIIENLK
jgi:hypothetical protein